jgi:hypothetical protein
MFAAEGQNKLFAADGNLWKKKDIYKMQQRKKKGRNVSKHH